MLCGISATAGSFRFRRLRTNATGPSGPVLSFTRSWSAPTYLGDGVTPAAGSIQGYMVYWDTTPGVGDAAANSHFVSGESTLSYLVSGLASGTYYSWVSARIGGVDGPVDNQEEITL